MTLQKKSVFISYRRRSGTFQAEFLADELRKSGFTTFMDTDDLPGGKNWQNELLRQIEECAHFVVLLTENSLERCSNADDVVRLEIEHAQRTQRNIIVIEDPNVPASGATFGCPPFLQSILSLQRFKLNRNRVALQSDLRQYIRQESGKPRWRRARDKPELENQFLILHSGEAKVDDAVRAQRVSLVEALKQLESDVHELGPTRAEGEHSQLVAYRLLTCRAAVILLDKGVFESGLRKRAASILAWRREMGLPAVVLKMPDVRGELPRKFQAFRDFPPLPVDATKSPSEMAGIVASQIQLQHRKWSDRVDPVATWLTDVIDLLTQLPEAKLRNFAKGHLAPPRKATFSNVVRSIAAMLFVADLKVSEIASQVRTFLEGVNKELRTRNGIPSSHINDFIDMVLPLWVGMEAGRKLLHASHVDELCGLQLPTSRFANHPIKRACANFIRYELADLGSTVTGEDAGQELALRFASTLKSRFGVKTERDVQLMVESNYGTFATFNTKDLGFDELQKLLIGLRADFPGVTFVLASDSEADVHTWQKLSPPVRIAMKRPEAEIRQRVEFVINKIEKIAPRRKEQDEE